MGTFSKTFGVCLAQQGAGLNLTDEYKLVKSAMVVQPSLEDIKIQNTLVRDLKSAGVWNKAELIVILSTHNVQSSLLNWKNPSVFIPTVETNDKPSHLVYEGFRNLIKLNYIPESDKSLITKDNFCAIIGIADNKVNTSPDFGSFNSEGGNTRRLGIRSRYNGDVAYFYASNPGANNVANNDSARYFGMSRNNENTFDGYINRYKTVFNAMSDGLPTESLFIGGGIDDVTTEASDRRVRVFYLFTYLTEEEYNLVITATEKYLKNYNRELIYNSYADRHFTGEPIQYSNTLIENGGLFRSINYVNGVYHLWEEINGVNPTWYIRKRTSTDGINFSDFSEPLLLPGGANQFDTGGQADPTVIYEGEGDWKMWYDALGEGVWSLGYATSIDGNTWNKVGRVLQKGAVGSWDDQGIHHPVCIKHDGVYYLYYSGAEVGYETVVHHIGLATSTDGINFTKVSSNPVLSAGSIDEFDGKYVRPSNPVLINGLWHMYYWGANISNSLGLAVSTDLINWEKKGNVYRGNGNVVAASTLFKIGSDPNDIMINIYYAAGANLGMAKATTLNMLPELTGFTSVGDSKYTKAVVTEPTSVYFNNILGIKKADGMVTGEYNWSWSAGTLTIFSPELPSVRYMITYE